MIDKIRAYFISEGIIDSANKIRVDFLGAEPLEFAISPMPTDPILNKYINGQTLRQLQFQLISCNYYGADTVQNIENSTFYEDLYTKIYNNNRDRKLPQIDGIQSIECLNNGSLVDAGTGVARYSIQMRITYIK